MIQEREYKKRREQIAKSLKSNSVAVLFSATPKQRSNDTEYPYRQNSNFYYLTGFKEDNAVLIIRRGRKAIETTLFVQKKERVAELWNGKRCGVKAAKKKFKYDFVYNVEKFDKKFLELIKKSQNIYYDFNESASKTEKLLQNTKHFYARYNLASLVANARLIKSPSEIAVIKKALSITKEAHHFAMKRAKELRYEYEIQAAVESIFKSKGAYSDAYTTIVAAGDNANTLHYIKNDAKLDAKELILMDAGCEYEYYSSDITRTFPISGKFTTAQKELYSLVLDVEKKIISMVRPNVLRSSLQKRAEELLCRGLVSLGILQGNPKKLIKNGALKKYYPHGIGHWMGLDVHDTAPYRDKKGKEIPLMEGMILTIEPGIYIDAKDKSVPKCYRGIGIRIEDDILVTHDGYENLSSSIAKEISDIEGCAF